YELLSGTTPFHSETWKDRPFHEVLRQLQEDDPPRPSTKFEEQTRTSSKIAERRGNKEPEHIREALHGDLDWITLKALERDRTKRYATPAELADDIQRYLDDDLVLATPPTFRYRSNKFVKRHKLAVVSAALIATGLLAVAISTTVQAVRIRRERD